MKVYLVGDKVLDTEQRQVGKVLSVKMEGGRLVTELELTAPPAEIEDPQLQIAAADKTAIMDVWELYCSLMAPRNRGLDDQTRALIRSALKVASLSECKNAVTGCYRSDYHMRRGEYAGRKGPKYNKISHILKGKRGGRTTREQIDFFLDVAQRTATAGVVPSGDPVRIRDAKNDVLAAYEFPGDEHTVRRGNEARQWLQEQGWEIGAREDGWPTFRPPA